MGGVPREDNAVVVVVAGVALTQREAGTGGGRYDLTKAVFKGLSECVTEGVVIQCQHGLGFFRAGRPDDGGQIRVAALGFILLVVQGQEGEWTLWAETLPGGGLQRLFAFNGGDDGVVVVIPLAGGYAGKLADARQCAVGTDNQSRAECAAAAQRNGQAAFVIWVGEGGDGVLNAADVAAFQCAAQGVNGFTIFDDVAQFRGVQVGDLVAPEKRPQRVEDRLFVL